VASNVVLASILSALANTALAPPPPVVDQPTVAVELAAPATAAPVRQAPAARPFALRGAFGLITAVGDTGIAGGVAFGKRLANNEKVELFGEVGYGRLYEEGLLILSGGALVDLTQIGTSTHPYVGGGVLIGKWLGEFGGAEAGLQVVLGVPFKLDSGREVRVEGRLGVLTGQPLIVVVAFGL
jgi:hypothetical protein